MGYGTHRHKSGGTIKQQLKEMRKRYPDINVRKVKAKERWFK